MSRTLEGLNREQREAVTTTEGPLLVIAGAGTGKTTVITRRVAYLIEKKLAKPSEILALTFTEKAAGEMEERVDILVPYGYIDTWISTFHAFGNRVLQENALDMGLPPDFKVMTRPAQILFFQQNLFNFDLDYYRPLSNPTKFIEAILSFISRCKDEDISPQDYKKYAEKLKKLNPAKPEMTREEWKSEIKRQEELARVYEKYEDLKSGAGLLDFGDQVAMTLRLFRTRPKVLKSFQERFKYILVDEFQDTNWSQNELVKLLAKKEKNICVVADDDQCLTGSSKISTASGVKRFDEIKKGNEVITAVGKGHLSVSKVNRVFKRKKNTRFITLTTKNGKKVTVTANHKMFCYVPPRPSNHMSKYHYVYLMEKRSLGWRLGITTNLAQRLKLERGADSITGLKAFPLEDEARYYEALWAFRYGIPLGVFKEREGCSIKGKLLEDLYQSLDTEKNARILAREVGVDLSFPHFVLDGVTRGNSKRVKINIYMCQRNYVSKYTHFKNYLKNPKINHWVSLQTSNKKIIKKLSENNIKLAEGKKGKVVRFWSTDIKKISEFADKLAELTGGFIEGKFSLARLNKQSLPALIMPASNILQGHYLPVVDGYKVVYDEIVDVKEDTKEETVYDIEVDKTHNFVADGVVVHNSIYRFRGAAISNVLEFRKNYKLAKVVTLIENYRSTQPILDSAYRLIQQNNPDRLEIREKINKKLLAVRKEKGGAPKEVFAETLGEEADLVANEIENLVGKRNQKSLQYKDIAILVRANSQADPFLRALNMKGIPSKFVGSQGLYERPEIRILIAFLNSIANLEDSLQLFTLATSELYEMPMEDAISAASFAKRRGKSLHWVFSKIDELKGEIEISKKGKEIIEGIREDLSAARELARKENAGKVLFEFLNKVGYLSALEQEQNVEAEIKIQSIARFFDRIREFLDLASNNSIRSFVEWLEVMRSVGDDPRTSEFDPEIDAVNVMTIHSAKGLEFRAVFLVSLVSDQFPSRQRSEAIPLPDPLIKETLPSGDFHTQEERRLFYVGATRAQDNLYFTWSRDMGGKRIKKVSPFVLEALDKTISENLVSKLSPMQRISLFESNGDELVVTKTEPKIIKLSQAAIDDYETCAYKYRYVHVLRLPILRHHTVIYGSALHQAVAAFYRNKMQKQKMPLAELLNVFENSWISEGFLSAEHEEKRLAAGKKVLEEFWNREKDSKELPAFIEKEFRFSLGETVVAGRFDRVDVKGGEVRIIDFKSTENRDQERLDSDAKEGIQLKVYALAYFKNYKVVPEFVGIYDLESGLVAGYKPTKEILEETEKEIIETAQNIRKNLKEDKFPANPKYFGRVPACTYCAYNSICPFSISRH